MDTHASIHTCGRADIQSLTHVYIHVLHTCTHANIGDYDWKELRQPKVAASGTVSLSARKHLHGAKLGCVRMLQEVSKQASKQAARKMCELSIPGRGTVYDAVGPTPG